MLQTALSYVWSASGIILIISVLLHSPKGDGMGGLASSGSSMFTSARSAEANRAEQLQEIDHLRVAVEVARRLARLAPDGHCEEAARPFAHRLVERGEHELVRRVIARAEAKVDGLAVGL